MQDYDVVTNDDHKVGHVVATQGEYLIVEHGLVRKQKHAVPREMAAVDDDEHVVRLTISKDVFDDGPKLEGDEVDRTAVAQYYGLADGREQPDTQGYGDLAPGDPARTAEQDSQQFRGTTPTEERVQARESMQPEDVPTGPRKGAAGIHQDRYEVKE